MVVKDKLYNQFIAKAKLKHGDKFDYSLVDYVNNKTNIIIICPEHGEFEQMPETHLKHHGCPKCFFDSLSLSRKKSLNQFISDAKLKHNDKYDYSLVDYVNNKSKVKILCPEHGEFEQTPDSHLRSKYGCVECSIQYQKMDKVCSLEDFISKSNLIHDNKYDYSLVDYKNAKTNVKITCPIHGEFIQVPDNHISKKYGCTKCSNCGVSKVENELIDFIKTIEDNVELSVNTILYPKHIDIYLPSKKIGFEFNGLYWHNELYKDKNYHLDKTVLAEEKGIKLIHIFEDEWMYKQDIVKSRIKNLLGLSEYKIFARKCVIKEVDNAIVKEFLNINHIQGDCKSKIKLGLYYDNELVSLMAFGFLRKNLHQKKEDNVYELIRFCNKLNTNVVGGADKLLKYFIKNYGPDEIISYADRRWSQGGLYEKLGFEFIHDSVPNYWYVNGNLREYRFKYRKDVLVREGYDNKLTEHEIMLSRGLYRIYDCGSKKYNLKLNK